MAEFRRLMIDGMARTVEVLNGGACWIDGRKIDLDTAMHLPPVLPGKVACVHLNFRQRLEELNRKQPPAPTYFWKPASCLNSHRGRVIRPNGCQFLNYEGEFAIVIGKSARNISPDDAPHYIKGYTIANDFGLHDFRDTDENSMVRVKGSDTLGPIGPALVTDWDFRNKGLRTLVDGDVVQEGNTRDLLWDPHYIVADLARTMTLEPFDLILIGTPANSRPVSAGSTVVVEVEGLGRLENLIADSETSIPAAFGAQPSASDAVRSVALGADFIRGKSETAAAV